MKKVYYIPVFLKDDLSIYEDFNPSLLSTTLDEYLMKEVSLCSFKGEVVLQVTSYDCSFDRNLFTQIVHQYYQNYVQYYTCIDHLYDEKRIVLLLLGVLCILFSFLFSFLLSELFSIAGWVALWEMFDDFLFEEMERRTYLKRYKLLANCTIEYRD